MQPEWIGQSNPLDERDSTRCSMCLESEGEFYWDNDWVCGECMIEAWSPELYMYSLKFMPEDEAQYASYSVVYDNKSEFETFTIDSLEHVLSVTVEELIIIRAKGEEG